MVDELQYLWPIVDARESMIAAQTVTGWPAGVHERLVALGLLREGERASQIRCPECQDHVEEVLVSGGPKGTRLVIACPVVLRVEITPAMLTQWILDHSALAATLARVLSLSGKCVELIPGRLWRLGRTKWKEKLRDVVLARGLHWDDGASLQAKLSRSTKPIVFVPLLRPPPDFWRTPPPLLVLSDVASLRDGLIDIEPLEIAAAIEDADARKAESEGITLTLDGLKVLIRQQVKAEGATQLSDDAMRSAYRHCGSVRQAAELLTRETGQSVTKDRVQRALTRAGGASAVLDSEDSDSIVRGVASQSRDKHGKPMIHSQTHERE